MSERHGDGDLDVDAAWAEIVAHWGVDGDDVRVVRSGEAPEHPVAEGGAPDGDATDDDATDAPATGDADAIATAETRDERPADGPAGDVLDAGTPPPAAPTTSSRVVPTDDAGRPAPRPPVRRDDLADDDPLLAALDEHFVPPEPPPLGGGDPLTTLAWLGALGGPVFLLVAALAWRSAPSLLIGAAVLAFVAGFVTLVVRMPDRDEDDDGAEV